MLKGRDEEDHSTIDGKPNRSTTTTRHFHGISAVRDAPPPFPNVQCWCHASLSSVSCLLAIMIAHGTYNIESGGGGCRRVAEASAETQVLVLRFCFPSTVNGPLFDKTSTEVVTQLAPSDKLCLSVWSVLRTLALTVSWFLYGAVKRSLYFLGLSYVPGPENSKLRCYHCMSCWISILKQEPHKRTRVPATSS